MKIRLAHKPEIVFLQSSFHQNGIAGIAQCSRCDACSFIHTGTAKSIIKDVVDFINEHDCNPARRRAVSVFTVEDLTTQVAAMLVGGPIEIKRRKTVKTVKRGRPKNKQASKS